MEQSNHHVAIITTIVIAHYGAMNSAVYTNSTGKIDMVLMVDKDVILFNKLGNCTIDKGLQL
jgi:hypothetical protein